MNELLYEWAPTMEKRKEKKTNSGEFVKYGWYKNGDCVAPTSVRWVGKRSVHAMVWPFTEVELLK